MKYYKYIFIFILCISFKIQSDQTKTVSYIFSDENTNQIVMNIEAALARAQASQGIIPNWAAEEITKKANINYMPIEEIIIENEVLYSQYSMVVHCSGFGGAAPPWGVVNIISKS